MTQPRVVMVEPLTVEEWIGWLAGDVAPVCLDWDDLVEEAERRDDAAAVMLAADCVPVAVTSEFVAAMAVSA